MITDAGYGSEENYVYSIGEEKEPRFEFHIPYGSYIKEQSRKHKKDIKNVKNWTYDEQNDWFICPNGRKVLFQKYQTRKNASGYEQNFKIYECEDCTGCPLKSKCTKAKGNRQVHWNPIFEEMKAKPKTALEFDHLALAIIPPQISTGILFPHTDIRQLVFFHGYITDIYFIYTTLDLS